MSYTEIRQEGGMPFGGMPYDVLLRKLEIGRASCRERVYA
jgi:hypothetical protein